MRSIHTSAPSVIDQCRRNWGRIGYLNASTSPFGRLQRLRWFRLCLPLAVSASPLRRRPSTAPATFRMRSPRRRIAIPAVDLSPLAKKRAHESGRRRFAAAPTAGVERDRHAERDEQHRDSPRHRSRGPDARRTESSRPVPVAGRIEPAPRKDGEQDERSRTGYRREVKVSAFHVCHIVQRRSLTAPSTVQLARVSARDRRSTSR